LYYHLISVDTDMDTSMGTPVAAFSRYESPTGRGGGRHGGVACGEYAQRRELRARRHDVT
jgi:hypothetical protein